jgi:hypothetical protein
MVLYVEVMAVGPFSDAVAGDLQYPAAFYDETRNGSRVIVDLFGIVEGTSASTTFATRVGISNVWDFSQHRIDPDRIDVDGLRSLFRSLAEGARYQHDLDRLLHLREHGFELYFIPNG